MLYMESKLTTDFIFLQILFSQFAKKRFGIGIAACWRTFQNNMSSILDARNEKVDFLYSYIESLSKWRVQSTQRH